MFRIVISFLALVMCYCHAGATTFTVNSLASASGGSGTSGSLRYCISAASSDPARPHLIQFSVAGTIALTSPLTPCLSDSVTIDGTTAPGYAGSPVVVLDGAALSTGGSALCLSTGCAVLGLEICNFPYDGILVLALANYYRIGSATGGCVIRNCARHGIFVNGGDAGVIEGNLIGTDATGTACAPNGAEGLYMWANANNNYVLNNVIACSGENGIEMNDCKTNTFQGNIIGSLTGSCGYNTQDGIYLHNGCRDNRIGGVLPSEANKVAGNLFWGIEVSGASTYNNTISGNSMSCNGYGGIDLNAGSNNSIAPPTITAASSASVSGTSLANAVIEVFRANDPTAFGCPATPGGEGTDFLGTVTASPSGSWSLSGSFDGYLVATQTFASDGTSEFSAPVYSGAGPTWVNVCSGPPISACIHPPAPANTTPAASLEICAGEYAVLSASGAGTLSWYDVPFGGTPLITGGVYLTPILTDTTLFYVGDSTCDTSLVRTAITVNVNPNHYVSQTIELCSGDSIAVGGIVHAATGIYTDTLSSITGCDSIITTDLTVHPPLDVTTSVVSATITANAPGMIYQWIDCSTGLAIPGQTLQSFTAIVDGSYAVALSDSMGCTDTSACEAIVLAGRENGLSPAFQVTFSPDGALIQIDCGIPLDNVHLQLLDAGGRMVMDKRYSYFKQEALDATSLAFGIYFLRIGHGGELCTLKLLRK